MKRYLTAVAIFISITAFAQDDKMPSQAEIQAIMKEAQKQLDNLDPETKHIMDSMGIKMPDMKAASKNLSKVNQADLQKEWDRQTRTVPLKDATRIASIAATPSTNNISAYIKSSQSKLFAKLKPQVKTVGDKLYVSFKSSGKTSKEIGNAAAGLWMSAKAQIAFYILSKACADDASDANNISNYAAMISMSGNEELAVPLLNNLNTRFPKNNIILNNLGQAWFGLGDVAKASKYLDSAIMISGAHTQSKLTKAKIEESKGNKTEAVKLVKEAIKEAYSQDKNAYLKKMGYSITTNDVKLPANDKPDQLNLGSFQPPPFPKSVAECISLEKVWSDFKDQLTSEIEKLQKESKEAAQLVLPASKKRFANGERITPIHIDVANLKIAAITETYNRKLKEWGEKFRVFVEERGLQIKKDYDATMAKLKEEDLEQTGEGKPNEDYCPQYRDASDKFLNAYNIEMENLYKEFLEFHKTFYNETAYYSVYAEFPEELKATIPALKGSWLFVMKEQAMFQSITQYKCAPSPQAKGGKLAEFDDVACQYHSELNLIFGSIQIDCSRMKTEFDMGPVKLGLNQNMDKENFMDQFVSCTAELTAGVGKAEIDDVIGIGPEIGGGLGIEIDRNGISDVYVIGKAELGVEVGAFEQSTGFEGRISLISGAYSGGFE